MDHRDGTPGKAQWKIGLSEERGIFQVAMASQWIESKFAWSLYQSAGSVAHLGVDRDHVTQVFVARFDEHADDEWHGYPCNYKKPQQRPPTDVLNDWLKKALLSPAKIRKIASGQRCVI
ncbi:hypothetical protein [uncultured Bradyrhizobium sp.]|nr:hypothetical protein [uncultured Bradyrhizobium sp.]